MTQLSDNELSFVTGGTQPWPADNLPHCKYCPHGRVEMIADGDCWILKCDHCGFEVEIEDGEDPNVWVKW